MNKKERESLISNKPSNTLDEFIRTMNMNLVPAAKSWLAGHYYLASNIVSNYNKNDAFLTFNESFIPKSECAFQKRSGFGLYLNALQLNDEISHTNMVRGDNYVLLAKYFTREYLNQISTEIFEITDISELKERMIQLYSIFMRKIIGMLTRILDGYNMENNDHLDNILELF